jgi:hypothetical protein
MFVHLNKVIQCFYDVGTVSGSPVRERCLKYVSQLAHRYKHSVMTVGWKLGEREREMEITNSFNVVHMLHITYSWLFYFVCVLIFLGLTQQRKSQDQMK